MNVKSTFAKTISTMEIQTSSGSDSYRVAIFTGTGTSAVLKAQSGVVTSGIGIVSLPLTAVSGQDLIIANNTNYVVALAVDGTVGRPIGFTAISDINIAWLNTTDKAPGFDNNPQAQTATPIRFACRIY
jgi:hypothetical protein